MNYGDRIDTAYLSQWAPMSQDWGIPLNPAGVKDREYRRNHAEGSLSGVLDTVNPLVVLAAAAVATYCGMCLMSKSKSRRKVRRNSTDVEKRLKWFKDGYYNDEYNMKMDYEGLYNTLTKMSPLVREPYMRELNAALKAHNKAHGWGWDL